MINWDSIRRYFTIEDFSDPLFINSGAAIDEKLLSKLIELKMAVNASLVLHNKIGGCIDMKGNYNHAKNSYHLFNNGCRAVDFHFDTIELNAREQFYEIVKHGFTGVGVYYGKIWENQLLKCSFHVDIRPKKYMQIWKKENERYVYFLK